MTFNCETKHLQIVWKTIWSTSSLSVVNTCTCVGKPHDLFLALFFFIFLSNAILFTGRTLTLLTILKLYLHTFTFTLHCSYLHYLYKQTGQALTLFTILTLYLHLHLHCNAHTYTIYTSTNYNTYNTISNHIIRLQSAYLHF